MSEYPHLKRAPITEAVLDIRVKGREDVQIDHFNALYEQVSGQYPDRKERHKWEGKLEFKKGASPLSTAADAIDGYMFYSADQTQILQSRLDGFTFRKFTFFETLAKVEALG
nr:TIGR04255 family protein [Bacteroidota bacterium]